MRINLAGFSGQRSAPHPKLLPESVGVLSMNQKPGKGDLRPWKVPLNVATVPASRQTIYRMGRDVISDANYWLSFTGVVHLMRGFISSDDTERTFYTGDGVPKVTDNTIGLAAPPYPSASRTLGVPKPATAPTLVASGGVSATVELRYYVYTYVTDRGEESAPSPVSLVLSCKVDDSVAISTMTTTPGGSHGINRIRIYRTQTGTAGDTDFFFLREILSSLSTSTDDGRLLGEVMVTTAWEVPPGDLSWLTACWNGFAAGITDDGAVRYCVPYKPYAWPVAYETLPPDAKAVALARFGQRLLVLTTARPLLVTGTAPDSLDEQPLAMGQSCIAPRSAFSVGHGVVWACPDGLAYFGDNGLKLLTAGILTRDEWQAMNPTSMVGAMYEGAYFATYTQGGDKKAFFIDPVNPDGMYLCSTGFDAVHYDELQDQLFVLNGVNVQKWDAGASAMTATFRSKVFTSHPNNLAAGRVIADVYPVSLKIDAGPLDSAEVTALIAARPSILSAPTATTLRYTVSVADRKPFPLPSDFLARDWQIEVSGDQVQGVVLASSMEETA